MRWPCRGEWWRRALDITLRDQSPPIPSWALGAGGDEDEDGNMFFKRRRRSSKEEGRMWFSA